MSSQPLPQHLFHSPREPFQAPQLDGLVHNTFTLLPPCLLCLKMGLTTFQTSFLTCGMQIMLAQPPHRVMVCEGTKSLVAGHKCKADRVYE